VSARLKVALRWLGGLLSICAIVYVVWRFAGTGAVSSLFAEGVPTALLVHVLIAALLYATGCTLLALAWWFLLSAFTSASPSAMPVAAAYATSQFAKYLPGNVAHYFARHAMLRRLQLPHGGLIAAAGLEAGCLVVAAMVWAVPAAGVMLSRWLHVPAGWLMVALIVGGVVGLVLLRLAARHTRLGQWIVLERPLFVLWAVGAHVGFFGVMALSLIVVAAAIPDIQAGAWQLTGVATTSWLAGFVVIGSPAGLGVREAVFAGLLHGTTSEASALLLAGAFRVVTFLGDLGFFAAGLLLMAQIRHRSMPD
jgi:uncharacterized membrane protein YbhN (UPF0104 family)